MVAWRPVQFGFMLGGSIVVEAVFSMHGVGHLAWEAIAPRISGGAGGGVILAAIYITLTFLADVINALLDPRMRVA